MWDLNCPMDLYAGPKPQSILFKRRTNGADSVGASDMLVKWSASADPRLYFTSTFSSIRSVEPLQISFVCDSTSSHAHQHTKIIQRMYERMYEHTFDAKSGL